jgi:hypothetical protein
MGIIKPAVAKPVLRYVRYIGGPKDGTVHTVGPETKLGDTLHVPVMSKVQAVSYDDDMTVWPDWIPPYKTATYTFHRTGPSKTWDSDGNLVNEDNTYEWVWIFGGWRGGSMDWEPNNWLHEETVP